MKKLIFTVLFFFLTSNVNAQFNFGNNSRNFWNTNNLYWNSGSWNWNNPYWQWSPIPSNPVYPAPYLKPSPNIINNNYYYYYYNNNMFNKNPYLK